MDERLNPSQSSCVDPERIDLVKDIFDPRKIGRRIAHLVAGKDPKELTKPQKKF